jgi:hypothetical protein
VRPLRSTLGINMNMTSDGDRNLEEAMRQAAIGRRGYADEFGWHDRDIEEWGVVTHFLRRSLERTGSLFFTDVVRRGRGNDPPDCEGKNASGERIAFEVTELVSGNAIVAAKRYGMTSEWATWTEQAFRGAISQRLSEKAKRLPTLKDGPYPGGYVVVIFSGEPNLTEELVSSYLAAYAPPAMPTGCSAYLVLRYHADRQSNPCFKLA